MKITILGTGCIWTKRACASYLIDDNILVDPGSGTLKQLLKSSDSLLHHEKIEKIKLILITHYHIDHYFDIVHFMWKLASEKNPNTSCTIICPPGGEERIKALCQLGMSVPAYEMLNFNKYIKFVDASKIDKFFFNNFEIKPLQMDHGPTLDFGYIIKEKNGKSVGFTGDTCYCKNLEYLINHTNIAFVDMAGTDISNKHFNIIDGIELMKKYKNKCNIVPAHLTSQALDYCVGKINPPKDLMVLDTKEDFPYNFYLEKEEKKSSNKDFKFENLKFDKLSGNVIDLSLSLTKRISANNKYPTYCYNILLHNSSTVIGFLNYSVVPDNIEEHFGNVSISLNEGYDLKSVKYESFQLIKSLAKFHGASSLYLTCSPKDLKTRKVFESLGATLQEIKTYTFIDEDNKREILEECIWNLKI